MDRAVVLAPRRAVARAHRNLRTPRRRGAARARPHSWDICPASLRFWPLALQAARAAIELGDAALDALESRDQRAVLLALILRLRALDDQRCHGRDETA